MKSANELSLQEINITHSNSNYDLFAATNFLALPAPCHCDLNDLLYKNPSYHPNSAPAAGFLRIVSHGGTSKISLSLC